MKLGIGLGPGHTVLDGDSAPPPQMGTAPQFSAHICCGQMAGWMKMPLGMEIGFGPGDCVGWGPRSPPQKGGGAPKFSAMFIVVNFGLLAAEVLSLVWGTPANLNGFRVLAALLRYCVASSSGRQPNCGVEQRAAITLGIGPHSS